MEEYGRKPAAGCHHVRCACVGIVHAESRLSSAPYPSLCSPTRMAPCSAWGTLRKGGVEGALINVHVRVSSDHGLDGCVKAE
jgi:hypothetical protein